MLNWLLVSNWGVGDKVLWFLKWWRMLICAIQSEEMMKVEESFVCKTNDNPLLFFASLHKRCRQQGTRKESKYRSMLVLSCPATAWRIAGPMWM